MFGFGNNKNDKANKKAEEKIYYTMKVIGEMTNLDPTKLPNDLRDTILLHALQSSGHTDNKYDFCASYMIALASVLHGMKRRTESDKVLQASISFVSNKKENITASIYNECQLIFDKCNP
jgi:hypothetical protein